jgi:hypothetical protein
MTKNSIRDRYKPISKNTKTLDPLLYYPRGIGFGALKGK